MSFPKTDERQIPYMEWEQIIEDYIKFSSETFTKATAQSSLKKLKDEELQELEFEVLYSDNSTKAGEEYVDCIMCLLDSANRHGITPHMLRTLFAMKLQKIKRRSWTSDENGVYKHT